MPDFLQTLFFRQVATPPFDADADMIWPEDLPPRRQ